MVREEFGARQRYMEVENDAIQGSCYAANASTGKTRGRTICKRTFAVRDNEELNDLSIPSLGLKKLRKQGVETWH